jgi:HlyD family secretion protein
MKKKVIPIILLAVLVVAAVSLYRWLNRDNEGKIAVSGNIELTEVKIAFKTAGRLVELAVDEGDAVNKDMVIARLDREQLLRQRDREQASLAVARSQLAQLNTAIEYQREILEGEIAARRAELSHAEARLHDWERAQTLYKNDDISTAQYDQFRTQHERAAAALKQVEQRLALVIEGPRKESIEAAKAQVAGAKAALRLAEATRLELKRKQQEVQTRRAEIDRALAQVAIIESQLGDREAVCPIDGVVLVKSAEVGETLAAGSTVVTVGDLEHPWLRGYINEQDLGRVKLGARVKVTTDSFPGKIYWGRLSFLASEAEFTPKQIQTAEERVKLVYRIKIDIPNPEGELKLNMPADAEILPEETEGPEEGATGR